MNCKPGDLAVIVFDGEAPQNIGRFVTVIELFDRPIPGWDDVGPSWTVLPRTSLVSVGVDYSTGEIMNPFEAHTDECQMPDKWLRPIRDPGDDAVDETLLWLPVPNREQESA
jgi:hypothetical protein